MKVEFDRVRLAVDVDGKTSGDFLIGLGDGVGARGKFAGLEVEWLANVCNFVALAARAGKVEVCAIESLSEGYEFPDDFGGRH